MSFNNILEELRIKNNLSKRSLSENSGVSYAQLNRLLDGSAQPTLPIIIKLSGALNIHPGEFFEKPDIEEVETQIDNIIRDYKSTFRDDAKREILNYLKSMKQLSMMKRYASQ